MSKLDHVATVEGGAIDIYNIGARQVFVRTENATVSISVYQDKNGNIATQCSLVPDVPYTVRSYGHNNTATILAVYVQESEE